MHGVLGALPAAGPRDRGRRVREGQRMYQPALRPDQVRALYYLKQQRRRPMTKLLREAVDQYLHAHSKPSEVVKERENREMT